MFFRRIRPGASFRWVSTSSSTPKVESQGKKGYWIAGGAASLASIAYVKKEKGSETGKENRDKSKPNAEKKLEAEKGIFDNVSLPDLGKFTSLTALTVLSLGSIQESLDRLHDEVSRTENSVYAQVKKTQNDPTVFPEIQWDANVRIGAGVPEQEVEFATKRRKRIVPYFAKLMGVKESEIHLDDIPTIGIASSGGGYRAMINCLGSLMAAEDAGVLDCVMFIAGVSGSCWAISNLYSLGEGSLLKTIRHLKSRITVPFLDFDNLQLLVKPETSAYLLSGAILHDDPVGTSEGLPIVDIYGSLVSGRLFVPDSLKVNFDHMKISNQSKDISQGQLPLPIYNIIHVPLVVLTAGEEEAEQSISEGEKASVINESEALDDNVVHSPGWRWFEVTPFEVGCDDFAAWVPTWAFGRRFDTGRDVEKKPELNLSIFSGLFASAFCASLYSYYIEVRPTFAQLPYFSSIEEWLLNNYQHALDHTHLFPPSEFPNFMYNLKLIDKDIASVETLRFLDAGAYLNIPYIPLLRRDCDLIITFDASADQREVWFERIEQYATNHGFRWPLADTEKLFPRSKELKTIETMVEQPPSSANPSKAWLPPNKENQLKSCNVWIGSSNGGKASAPLNGLTPEKVMEMDGIGLAYFPLIGNSSLPNPEEIWSTWNFAYQPKETERLVELAKYNFMQGERDLLTTIRGLWYRKRRDRLLREEQLLLELGPQT